MTLPKTYCITLRETSWRMETAHCHFHDRGIQAEFFYGICGRAWNLRQKMPMHGNHFISQGHVGLLLSHYMLWTVLTHLPHEEVLILEDDVVFEPDFHERFAEAYAELPTDWQWVHVGSLGAEQRERERITDRVSVVRYPWGTHAYMIRRSVLPFLLATMGTAWAHVDIQLERWVWPHIRQYAFLPSLVSQRACNEMWPQSVAE